MSLVKPATAVNRIYLAQGLSLGSDFRSDIADFRDMPMGAVQIVWTGATGTLDGRMQFHASLLPEESTFDGCEIDDGFWILDEASSARLWIRQSLGFRFLQARYTANGCTGGTIDIIAHGKKS
jgi:hypothetical protein